ncbi:MAG: hypothetical protein VR64_23520 [Desulfatitalea sp. BRH_c12]|nr:MAG: hypothetical protein VR64_23520 [Desulfatitalea sp. BRH_c12]
MVIFPDFHILKMLLDVNPLYVVLFFTLLAITVYCCRKWLRSTEYFLDKIITCLAIFFVFIQLHLMAFLCICLLFIFLYSKEQFGIAYCVWRTTAFIGFLCFCSLISIAGTQVLAGMYSNFQLEPFEAFRKLYNYPYIFERFFTPIVDAGLPITLFLGGFSAIGLIWAGSHRKPVAFVLLIMIICISIIGAARTHYVHIRYAYFIIPLFIFSVASMIDAVRHKIPNRFKPTSIIVFVVILMGAFQIRTAVINIVMAQPGTTDQFTPQRVLADYETCATFLNRSFTPEDCIVAIGSPHQAAVYVRSPIHFALKLSLKEYTADSHHYITGSLFFEEKADLKLILERAGLNPIANVWVLFGTTYLKPGSWQSDFAVVSQPYVVCRAKDNINSLARIPAAEMIRLLETH